MGPGANAQVENLVLSEFYPEINFWDQPKQKSTTNAFKNLIDAAEIEVRRMIRANNGAPIKAVAHSFGGIVFHQLTLRDPHLFSSCKFYGSGYDIPDCFFRLLKVAAVDEATPPALRKKMMDYLEGTTVAKASEIWDYIGLITQDPSFFRLYWPVDFLFQKYVAVASKTEGLDMESFQHILNDFLAHYFRPHDLEVSSWNGPMSIDIGSKDPILDINNETKLWRTAFPQAEIRTIENAGHFLHLEKHLGV